VVVGGGGGVESIERRCWCLEVSREAAVERQALSVGGGFEVEVEVEQRC
jgi:hypothetical protein